MTSYYVNVCGTERDPDTKQTKQTWGTYIVSEETPEEAGVNAASQYIQMRTLNEYTEVTAFVRLEGSLNEAIVCRYAPKSGHDWVVDAAGHQWQMS